MKLNETYKDNHFVVPDFQRDFVWEIGQQRACLATFLSFLPIHSFLVLRGKGGDFCSKAIGFPDRVIDLGKGSDCVFLLDGQQRYTTLISTFSNIFGNTNDWNSNWEEMWPCRYY